MDNLFKEIFSYHDWRQQVYLGNDVYTPGHIKKNIWKWTQLPNKIKGETLIDIGANDGKVVVEALLKGAEEVTACDMYIANLDSMSNGWPINGILLLNKWLKQKINIETEGIFNLQNHTKKYDHVVMTDVLNWVGDIDKATSILCNLSTIYIYIADQFIKGNTIKKEKSELPSLAVFNEMCTLNYLLNQLKKNGFKVVKIQKLNPFRVDHDSFVDSFILTINHNSDLYELPCKYASKGKINKGLFKSAYKYNDYFFIRKKGWVKASDVVIKKNKASLIYKIFKAMSIDMIYFKLQGIKHQTATVHYSIKAVKL